LSCPAHCSQHHSRFIFGEPPRKLIILNAWFQLWNIQADLWRSGHHYLSILLVLQLFQMVKLLPVTVWTYQVHPVVQMFPNNDAVFQDDNSPIHTPRSVQSWFEEHEEALKHLLWPAQLPDLNINKPLWSVLDSRVRSRFPPSSSLQQLNMFFMKSCTVFHYGLFITYMSLFQEGYKLYYRQMVAQLHINKEMSFTIVSIILSIPCTHFLNLMPCSLVKIKTYKKLTLPPSWQVGEYPDDEGSIILWNAGTYISTILYSITWKKPYS